MIILGIETSCDETACALVQDGTTVLSSAIASSVSDQAAFGGVFPEVAARRQLEYIMPVLNEALQGHDADDIDAIAVTKGPGLLVSLIVGVSAARALASVWGKPLIGVHHTQGHLDSVWLECADEIQFPVLTLSVSGGHTDLWLRRSHTDQVLLGSTMDDAAGEAFDKGAAQLGLPYPGGPALSTLAESGDASSVKFPTMLHGKDSLEFSFSGLKTALKYELKDRGTLSESEKADIAASYQDAICRHLVSRIEKALDTHSDIREVHLVGGVSANRRLRELMQESVPLLRLPQKMQYCTDNAAMIAGAACFLFQDHGERVFESFKTEASVCL